MLRWQKTTGAIHEIAGKPGLRMSYKKTEIMCIGQASGSNLIVPLGNEGLIKIVDHFMYFRAFAVPRGLMSKSWTVELRKHQQPSESWTRCGAIETSIWTPKWNFTPPVSFPHFYMHVIAGHSLREMKPDLMLLTYAARTKQPQLTAFIRKRHLQWFGHTTNGHWPYP